MKAGAFSANNREIITVAVIGAAVIGVVYLAAKGLLGSLGGLLTGNNNFTKNQTDASGNPVDYSGGGIFGTLGAGANAVSGGSLASIGERAALVYGDLSDYVSEGISAVFHPTAGDSNIDYILLFPDGSRHAIPGDKIDSDGYFSFGGKNWRAGYDTNRQKVATPA